jgi:hypothetical protein
MAGCKAMMNIHEIGAAMFAAKTARMSDDMTKAFIIMTWVEQGLGEFPVEVAESFSFKLIKQRLKVFYKEDSIATDSVIGVCALLSDRPGMAVLYAATIAAMYEKHGHVVMRDLVEFFPDGFPTEEEIHKIWTAQKIGGGNSVDNKAAWEPA